MAASSRFMRLHRDFHLAGPRDPGLDRPPGPLVFDPDLAAECAIGLGFTRHSHIYSGIFRADYDLIPFAYHFGRGDVCRR